MIFEIDILEYENKELKKILTFYTNSIIENPAELIDDLEQKILELFKMYEFNNIKDIKIIFSK